MPLSLVVIIADVYKALLENTLHRVKSNLFNWVIRDLFQAF